MRTMDVVPYDENWKTLFDKESIILRDILGDIITSIEHFGSTSIEGLSAKPIIDILVFVSDINEVDQYSDKMTAAGYDVRGEHGMPGRRYFVRFKNDNSGNHTHHIHIYQPDNQAAKDELLFRDYLRLNEIARKEYNDVKISLSKKHYTEPLAYTNGKTECVLGILEKARGYFNDRQLQFYTEKDPSPKAIEQFVSVIRAYSGEHFTDNFADDVAIDAPYQRLCYLKNGDEFISGIMFTCLDGYPHITAMATKREYKGRGYGKQLIYHFANYVSQLGFHDIELYAWSEKTKPICASTQAFYKSVGFVVEQEHMGLWVQDMITVKMKKSWGEKV